MYTLSWVWQGGQHFVKTDEKLSGAMVARAVSKEFSARVTVYQGQQEVAVYRDGELVT